MKRRTRIVTDLNRASERVAVGRYEGNASSRALVEDYRNRSFSLLFVGRPVLLPRYSLGVLNYASRHERFGMVLEWVNFNHESHESNE